MARPLRIVVEDGWYHVISRGLDRGAIFADDRDRVHFLKLLAEARERYRLVIHAYVLMVNHLHAICQVPDANLSGAMQWVLTSYAGWYNRRHQRMGPLFQGRYKSVLVEQGAWAYELSLYVHLNPLRIKALGLGKEERGRESLGWKQPSAEQVKARLEKLRKYRWSSYRAYAGYASCPDWLTREAILSRAAGSKAKRQGLYRSDVKEQLTLGMSESFSERMAEGVALGTAGFMEKVRRGLDGRVVRELPGKKALMGRVSYVDVIEAVELIRREPAEVFMNEYGGWSRGLVLWGARQYAGMTLRELGDELGKDYGAIAMRLKRFEQRSRKDRRAQHAKSQLGKMLLVKTRPQ